MKQLRSAVHLGILTEKRAFGSQSTTVIQLIYIYIYICCYTQTDCFVLSELFSVARHEGRSKSGSKPIQLYVRLSLRPLGQQADYVGKGNFLRYSCSNSSSVRLFTFFYPVGYQSAQFFRRALHYASGSRQFFARVLTPIGERSVCVCV